MPSAKALVRAEAHHEFLRLLAAAERRPWYAAGAGDRPNATGRRHERLKRGFDVAVAVAALPLVFPALAVCIVAIKLDSPGPAVFVQLRTGRGGRLFRMFKLRTMVLDAEKFKEEYRGRSSRAWPDFKIEDDPRITRVGAFLRRTSLDELPQVFNVLRGDMSWVGPRPTSFSPRAYSLWHTARLAAKPGVTGLWQVMGRNRLEFDERVRLDVAYLRHESLWLDLRILARTVGCVLSGRGAC